MNTGIFGGDTIPLCSCAFLFEGNPFVTPAKPPISLTRSRARFPFRLCPIAILLLLYFFQQEQIVKDGLRIVAVAPAKGDDSYEMKYNYHPECFNLPRKYSTGAGKMSAAEFVAEILQDESREILPDLTEKLAKDIAGKHRGAAGAAGGGAADADGKKISPIAAVKEAHAARVQGEPVAKKAKKEEGGGGVDPRLVDSYDAHHKEKIDELKDVLRWNRQHLTGTKDVLLQRIMDGEVHGRLPLCPVDGGRLKLSDDSHTVSCAGTFDEATQTRLDCSYRVTASDAPRAEWYVKIVQGVRVCARACGVCLCECLDFVVFAPRHRGIVQPAAAAGSRR